MSYSLNTNIPAENHRPVLFLHPFINQEPTWHPGDATYSTPSGGHVLYDHYQEANLQHPLTPRRRSSATYPYPASSPTRSRFAVAPPSHHVMHQSPPRNQNISNMSSTLGPDRRGRAYGRIEEPLGYDTRRGPRAELRAIPLGPTYMRPIWPTNHDLLPQPEHPQPASSMDYIYRYDPIQFQLDGFPEVGIKVGAVDNGEACRLEGYTDCVLQDVSEREIQVRLNWPGYASTPIPRRIKTANGKLQRGVLTMQLAKMVLDLATNVQYMPVDTGEERWRIKTEKNPGIDVRDVFITRLVHRGGSHWQMDLWVPKGVH